MTLLLEGIFYGALGVLVLYHLALFASLRDRTLLFFTGFLSALTASLFIWDGHALRLLWPGAPAWDASSRIVVDSAAALLGILFARELLGTARRAPRLDRLLRLACAGCALGFPLALPGLRAVGLAWVTLLSVVAPLLLLGTGIHALQAGSRAAPTFLVACGVLLLGTAAEGVLAAVGTASEWGAFGTYVGALGMGTLFSLGLADHQRRLVAERERSRVEAEGFRAQSLRDGLTGLWNRRHLDEQLALEGRRAAREGAPLSLLLVDVDRFKRFNDHYGHPEGDACLRAVAAALDGQLRRPSDLAARYGGEEFAVVLPGATADGAARVAQGLVEAVAALGILHERSEHGQVTVSVGAATRAGAEASETAALVEAADRALYEAKQAGRNRAVARGASPTP